MSAPAQNALAPAPVTMSARASEAAIGFAREATGHSLPVLGFARAAVRRAFDLPLTEGLKVEAELGTLAFQTRDAEEGMAAFAEKRRPDFRDA